MEYNISPRELYSRFKSLKIEQDEFHHFEHLVVACQYLEEFPFDKAIQEMRSGLIRLLDSFEIPEGQTPYHETITVFWMHTIFDFRRKHGEAPIEDLLEEIQKTFGKEFIYQFYTKEFLASDLAREKYFPPNIKKGA